MSPKPSNGPLGVSPTCISSSIPDIPRGREGSHDR